MKKIEAIIRPNKLDDVKQAINDIGVLGMTVFEVRGLGRQKGHTAIYRGNEYYVDVLPKLRVDIVVEDNKFDQCLQAVIEAARTGKIGDGKIFTSSIENVIRIRTGEQGEDAM